MTVFDRTLIGHTCKCTCLHSTNAGNMYIAECQILYDTVCEKSCKACNSVTFHDRHTADGVSCTIHCAVIGKILSAKRRPVAFALGRCRKCDILHQLHASIGIFLCKLAEPQEIAGIADIVQSVLILIHSRLKITTVDAEALLIKAVFFQRECK